MWCAILIIASALAVGVRPDCIEADALAESIDKALEIVNSEGADVVQWEPVHVDPIFKISTGEIFGLKSMKRIDAPRVQCLAGRFSSVNVTIKMANVKIVYPWILTGFSMLKGRVYSDTKFIKGDVYFIRSSNDNEPLIFNKFDVTEVGAVNTRVTGASYVTWIASYLVTGLSNVLKHAVGDALEKQIGHTICDVFNKANATRKVIDNTQ